MVENFGGGDDGDDVVLDLLGDPARPYTDGRGRPKLKVSNAMRDDVAAMVADRWSQERIASVIGCSVPTLREWFSFELQHGRDVLRREALRELRQQVRAGNVAAIKTQIAITDDTRGTPTRRRGAVEPTLGKKEQKLRDARAVPESSSWSDLLN